MSADDDIEEELDELHNTCLLFLAEEEALDEDTIQRVIPAFVYLYQQYYMESGGVH